MRFFDYINSRLGFTIRHSRVMDKPVPGWINYFYCFGGITFTLFLVQLLTGLLLSVHYTPSEAEAYGSIQRMYQAVPLGLILRSTHHWAANFMVVMVLLHMLRSFHHQFVQESAELNWIAGAFLFAMTLAFGFTGYPAAR
jgi:quinol-cytochrome oxidoreductase complex cytochrome b subunit